jgi:hypothetical protein
MQTSEVLNKAADLIEERGWSQGTGWHTALADSVPVCAEGGIWCATETDNNRRDYAALRAAKGAFRAYLTDRFPEHIHPNAGCVIGWSWNDDPERTAAEVIEVLRAAAVIEQARESEART